MKNSILKSALFLILLFSFTKTTQALPIDWHGVFGCETTSIDNYRRLESTTDNSSNNGGSIGSQEIPLAAGNNANANWQNCIFRLEPNIIINDSATLKMELTNGYARSQLIGGGGPNNDGDIVTTQAGNSFGNALYPYAFSDGQDSVVINKLHMELYADTATYLIGRHTNHYGLGAVVNSGEDTWDRYTFIRDGITIKIKIGNFSIEPFWARLGTSNSLTKSTRVKEIGASLVYDNPDRDMAFGILYTKKKSAPFSDDYQFDISNTSTPSALGRTNVKLTDLYFSKTYGIFDFGIEVPILSGEIGNIYGNTTQNDTKYKARAIIFEADLNASDSLSFGLHGGQVSGHDGSTSSFEAMYLNPNYHVANLLFRYNLNAVSNTQTKNVYDSYLTNARYLKFQTTYTTENWTWEGAIIKAWAEEAARIGESAFNHTTNRIFTAQTNQDDDLGLEVDVNFEYAWNTEISIGGSFGYLFTGDYFSFNDTTTPNSADDSYVLQLKTSISF